MMSVYQFFKPEADSKSLRFLWVDEDSDPKRIIITDKEKFFAILSNLIKNAIKFTNSGFIEMGYAIKQNEYEFFVKDSGIGIANDKLEIIFERFVQADLSISRPYEGAGLGLAIAKEYVEMLGGRIWVESQPGAGSQFYFTVPASESRDFVLKEREMLYKMTPGPDSTINILIAEDTEHSDLYLTQVVKKFCKTIFHVKTGTQAVEVCKNNSDIDLILIDIKMPEMDGYQAARLIRQFNQKVVIIAQTAYALTGDREKALLAGCNDYLAKPVRRDTLLRVISRFFPLV
jgi:CheY-like chemotaxis protein